jgi:hypothetical protein
VGKRHESGFLETGAVYRAARVNAR